MTLADLKTELLKNPDVSGEYITLLEARVAELEAAQVTAVFVVLPHLDYEGYGAPLSAHTTREAAWLAAAAIKKQGNDKYTKYEVEEVALAAEKGDGT